MKLINFMNIECCLLIFLTLAFATQAVKAESNDSNMIEGPHYYVSALTGSDETGVGSFNNPWQTIHQALFNVPFDEDNAVIHILEGTYTIPATLYFEAERGGSEGQYFTVKAYNDDNVIIDGSLLASDFSSMIFMSSTRYIRIEGLHFTHLRGPKSGILIEGTSHNIQLINNTLSDMTWVDQNGEDAANPAPSDNLNPIAVIGNDATAAIHNITISGNELYNIVPGYSEGIKIVGNVTDFSIIDNYIHDIANIAIVAAGNYDWVNIPAELNHARNGIIRGNRVHNAVSPVANSAGIYLDGAHNMLVENNVSYNNSVGFSVGCEQPGSASNNVLKNNVAYDNDDAGLVVGTIHADAIVTDTLISHNEFKNNYSKGGWGGEMTIQQTQGLTVTHNIFNSRSDMTIVAAQNSTDLMFDQNLYFGLSNHEDTIMFDWGGISATTYIGLSTFQEKTCLDINSLYSNPTLIDFDTTSVALNTYTNCGSFNESNHEPIKEPIVSNDEPIDEPIDELKTPELNPTEIEVDTLYQIQSIQTGFCLDIVGASQHNDAKLIEWPCHGNTNQQFRLIDETSDTFSLTVKHSEKVITYHSGQNIFVQKDYKENDKNQLMSLKLTSNGGYTICNKRHNTCIGNDNAATYILTQVTP